MDNRKVLLEELDNYMFDFTEEQLNYIYDSENTTFIIKKVCEILSVSKNFEKINYFNKIIIIFLSNGGNKYFNSYYFFQELDNTIWEYIFDNFDDDKLHSLIIVLYLCILNTKLRPEYIIKVLKVCFSDSRMCDLITDTEIFYNDRNTKYGNSKRTLLGILLSRIAYSKSNYDSRLQKTVELFYILLRNKVAKPRLLKWLCKIVNDNKSFSNNYSFYEDYDKGLLCPSYYKLLTRILYILWDDAKKKSDKNKFENIRINYLNSSECLIEWEEKDETLKLKNKIFEDTFFILVRLQNLFFNNFESMITEYDSYISDTRKELRSVQLSGLNVDVRNKILDHLTESQLIRDDINNLCKDSQFTNILKNFQKDFADIININLKKNVKILDSILETNVDLINSLRIFEDSFYNYNYTNFENSVILFNYPKLVNPFIKNKYCVYSSYYIIDNTSRNVCDLRFKYITNNLVPNLLNFYIALEDLEDDSFYDKNYARTNIINFFNFICFKEPYIYAEQLKKYAKSNDKKFIRFVNLYINDLSNVFDETFTLIRDINKLEKEDITVSLLNKIEIYNDRPKLKELYKKYKYADSFLSTLRFMLSFLMTLSKYCDNILMCNELGAKFCSQINYFLNELTNVEKRKFYIIKNKYDIDFQPLHLLNYLSQVYLNLISHDNFTSFMSNDLRSFRKENIKFLGDKLWSNNMITDNEGLRLNKMSEKVEQLIEKEKQDLQVPDEFCDPLMASEINEPIILPGTETIMEKSVISRHLLTDQHNPFNREKLTLEELEKFNSQESVQLKIKDFMARKNKWKLNN